MPLEDFIILVYCLVDDFYKETTKNITLRHRGPQPKLTDSEVITMDIVGEYLGLNHDKNIWAYFKIYWKHFFPTLGCRTTYVRQSANLWRIKSMIQAQLSQSFQGDLAMFDGFPIPICHIKRYKKSSLFKNEGAVGYCASKDEKYFGFSGNLMISRCGGIRGFALTPANIDERDVLPEVVEGHKGILLADKGLIRPQLSEIMAKRGIDLQTPLRKNMQDLRSKKFVKWIVSTRRLVETVIGQLTDRFNIQRIRAQDLWHLGAKIGRKLLAHTVCLSINTHLNPYTSLQIERILAF
jgi:hypothetical protein